MDILIVETFFGGSHRQWIEGLCQQLQKDFDVQIEYLTLSDKHWKWRIEGGSLELARECTKFEGKHFDVVLTSSMVHGPVFFQFASQFISWGKKVLMMHENQFAYPRSKLEIKINKRQDFHYPHVNFLSCLDADQVVFNSHYNLESMLEGAKAFLERMPRHKLSSTLAEIRNKSQVIPLGFTQEDYYSEQEQNPCSPLILWNHRWDEDKNPTDFFNALESCADLDFKLVVLGKAISSSKIFFSNMQERWNDRILHWGFCDSRNEYLNWLSKSHIAPVTSNQDFFGISAFEALLSGCQILAPNRLAFPEVLGTKDGVSVYQGQSELELLLRRKIIETQEKGLKKANADLSDYFWPHVTRQWMDEVLRKG